MVDSPPQSRRGSHALLTALMLGYADAFHYQSMTQDIYRFRPMTLRAEDTRRIHGIDERIAVPDYLRHIRFYAQLMQDLQSL